MTNDSAKKIKKGIQIKTKLRLAVVLSSIGMVIMCWLGIIGMNAAFEEGFGRSVQPVNTSGRNQLKMSF